MENFNNGSKIIMAASYIEIKGQELSCAIVDEDGYLMIESLRSIRSELRCALGKAESMYNDGYLLWFVEGWK